jgi:altronate hydrolase
MKIATNTELAERLSELIDFDCGSILDGAAPDALADALLAQLIATASGERTTQADRLGQHDFIFWRRDISL